MAGPTLSDFNPYRLKEKIVPGPAASSILPYPTFYPLSHLSTFSPYMRLVADPRPRLLQERTKLLLIEVAENGFADNGIISELEGL